MAGELNFDAYIENSDFKRQIDEMSNKIKGLTQTAAKEGAKTGEVFDKLGKMAGAAFSGIAIQQFITKIIEVRGEFQQLQIGFETMLGSKGKADQLMGEVVDLAAKTPFTLQDVAGGAKQLLAYQVPANEVVETLRRMGDVSSGLGVPLGRLITVFGQVRAKGKLMGDDLKQFTEAGIPILSQLADKYHTNTAAIQEMVSAGKIGFNDVKDVIYSMTDQGGMFYNIMEKNSHTLTGQISNLEDAWSRMLNDIGSNSEGILNGAISGASYLIEHYETIIKILGVVAAAYGTYKAAIIAVSVAQKVSAGIKFAQEYLAMGRALGFATANQVAFNTAVLANPYVIAAAAIVAVITAVALFSDTADAATEAQNKLNNAMEEAQDKIDTEKAKSEALIDVINDETIARDIRQQKLNEFKNLSPDILSALTLENMKTDEGRAAINKYNQALQSKIKLQALEAQLEASKKTLSDAQKGQKSGSTENVTWYEKLFSYVAQAGSYEQGGGMAGNAINAGDIQREIANNRYADVIKAETENQKKIRAQIAKLTAGNGADGGVQYVVKNAEYWDNEVKRIKKSIEQLDPASKNFKTLRKQLTTDLASAQSEYDKLKAPTTGKSGGGSKTKKKTAVELLQDELDAKKKAYEGYQAWADKMGVNSANEVYKGLLEGGKTYKEYLQKQLLELQKDTSKTGRAKTEAVAVELSGLEKTQGGLEIFVKGIEDANKKATGLADEIRILQKAQNDLATGGATLTQGDREKAAELVQKQLAEKTIQYQQEVTQKYQTFADQRVAIEKQASDDITMLTTMRKAAEAKGDLATAAAIQARIDMAEKLKKQMLGDLGMNQLGTDQKSLLDKVFGDLKDFAPEAIISMVDRLISEMDKLDEATKNSDGFKQMKQQLEGLKEQAKNDTNNPFVVLKNAWDKYTEATKAAKDGTKESMANEAQAFAGVIGAAGTIIQGVQQTFDQVTNGLQDMGVKMSGTTQDLMGDISGMLGGAANLAMGIATGNPLQIIQGSIDLIVKGIQVFDFQTRGINYQIEEHQAAVKKLEAAYTSLAHAVDNALGTDYQQAQQKVIENLKKQQQEQLKMAQLEASKSKADQEAVDAYKKASEDLGYQIEDATQALMDKIMGGVTVQDAAQKLGDALFDAAMRGIDGMKAYGEVADDIIKQIVKSMLQQKFIEQQMQPLIDQLYSAIWTPASTTQVQTGTHTVEVSNGNGKGTHTVTKPTFETQTVAAHFNDLTQEQADNFKNGIADISQQYNDALSQLNDILDFGTSGDKALTGAIKGITEETASILAGQMNAMRIAQADGLVIARQNLVYLETIAKNTSFNKYLADIYAYLTTQGAANDLRASGL